MIIGEVKRYLRDNNIVRVSRSVRDLAYRALSARETLVKKLNREPTTDDIAALLRENGIEATNSEISDALEAIIAPVSLYDPICGDGGDEMCVCDKLSDSGCGEEEWIESIALKEAISQLGEREKNILNLRFFKGRTQTEIAEEIGISQAQVSRLEKGAISRIKSKM